MDNVSWRNNKAWVMKMEMCDGKEKKRKKRNKEKKNKKKGCRMECVHFERGGSDGKNEGEKEEMEWWWSCGELGRRRRRRREEEEKE